MSGPLPLPYIAKQIMALWRTPIKLHLVMHLYAAMLYIVNKHDFVGRSVSYKNDHVWCSLLVFNLKYFLRLYLILV